MSADRRLRVVTWNVHGCVGRSGRYEPDAVVTTLRRLAPDIVGLQEVDTRHDPDRRDTFHYLSEALGWSMAEARTIRGTTGDYGHLLLSRWPLAEVERLDLSVFGREPRLAITCVIQGPVRWRTLATHLGLRARERGRQLRRIRTAVDTWPDGPAVILGDFNEWRRRGPATRALCPPFVTAAAPASFPSGRPFLPLDRVWCRRPLAPHAAFVDREARELSDHLPVVADLTLTGARHATHRSSRRTPGDGDNLSAGQRRRHVGDTDTPRARQPGTGRGAG